MSLEALTCGQSLSDKVTALTFNESAVNDLTKYKLMKYCILKIINYLIIIL